MAPGTTPLDLSPDSVPLGPGARTGAESPLARLLAPVASPTLTVALFALSIALILIGTLAQDKMDIGEVLAGYFRARVARVGVEVLFPQAWFPRLGPAAMRWIAAGGSLLIGLAIAAGCLLQRRQDRRWTMAAAGTILVLAAATAVQCLAKGVFVFPGGATIGSLLVLNLLAAHLVRFRIQARGLRLLGGLAVMALGGAVTWAVIASGHNKEGLQGLPVFEWKTLWWCCKAGLTALAAVTAGYWVTRRKACAPVESAMAGAAAFLLIGLSVWLWWAGDDAYLGDAGMRILWQLIQGALAGTILLVACVLLFYQRGGLVLIHAGLGLMMLGEWFVSAYAVEEHMTIREGETVNWAQDLRETELAIVTPASAAAVEDVVAVPRSTLLRSAKNNEAIRDVRLPFDLRVVKYFKNSAIQPVPPGAENPATAGHGLQFVAEEVAPRSGAGSEAVDAAAAYVECFERSSGRSLGTYLFSQHFSVRDLSDRITADGQEYLVSLRFKRSYKPYTMQLIDFRKDDYVGTSTARNFSSDVRLVDPTRQVDRRIRIWMNNPLRYAGETFYQSSYQRDPETGTEATTLQVVTNTGWMIPYVACMLMGTGMLAHFWSALLRFLRQSRTPETLPSGRTEVHPTELAAAGIARGPSGRSSRRGVTAAPPPVAQQPLFPRALTITVVGLLALWFAYRLTPEQWLRKPSAEQFDLRGFAALPVAYQGRVKPLDTLARNTLRRISGKETFKDAAGKTQPAVRWLLDVVANSDAAEQHRVFRIDNFEVLETLGLTRRPYFRYSLEEITGPKDKPNPGLQEFDRQVNATRKRSSVELTYYDRKLIETSERFNAYMMLVNAFQPSNMAGLPDVADFEKDRDAAIKTLQDFATAAAEADETLRRMEAPLAVPVANPGEKGRPWVPYATACNKALLQRFLPGQNPTNPAVDSLVAIFAAHAKGDAATFNAEVAKYGQWLQEHRPQDWSPFKLDFEVYYNGTRVFENWSLCSATYLIAFVALLLAWLGAAVGRQRGWFRTCNGLAYQLIWLAAYVHTFGIIARIIISGRPPVTNLYSSAVFIAWACVVAGLMLEYMFRLGFGNLVASVAGFLVLLVASSLANRGDTFTVMQAVLDTQFWLATHVVTIALGYAVTFVAGLLGLVYIITGVFTPGLSPELGKTLTRMTYGTVCFALFFSLVGTVLGGLWADDSWGRFWGWDPKENGALIIVLWQAIVLHARGGGLAQDRGLALLAVGGNIVTAWSWFGVNELGKGLHAYGFTEGVLFFLAAFAVSQLAVIVIGLLPPELWFSYRSQARAQPRDAGRTW